MYLYTVYLNKILALKKNRILPSYIIIMHKYYMIFLRFSKQIETAIKRQLN